MHCLKFAMRKNLICLHVYYAERKAQNHVRNLGYTRM